MLNLYLYIIEFCILNYVSKLKFAILNFIKESNFTFSCM